VIGEYTLQDQRGAKGYYGKVRLEVAPQDTPGIRIRFVEKCDPIWRTGIELGITYGWELWQREQGQLKGINVEVVEVTGQMVDTNSIVMAFVAANAFWKGLDWVASRPPTFDAKTGCFTFPK
jgi:hypothetical protein